MFGVVCDRHNSKDPSTAQHVVTEPAIDADRLLEH
jgi:hypothetical protein